MNKSKLVKQLALGVGFGSFFFTGAALATGHISSFDYTQEFEFVEPVVEAGVNKTGTTDTNNDVNGNTKLAWGVPHTSGDPQSSLVINAEPLDLHTPSGDLTAGTVTVADWDPVTPTATFALGPRLTHNNIVLDSVGTTLVSTAAEDFVVLKSGGNPDQTQNITFGVNFKETPNGGNPAGVPDIFALTGLPAVAPVLFNEAASPGPLPDDEKLAFLIDSFLIDDFHYDVYLAAVGLGPLTSGQCADAGVSFPCIGFTTPEEASTTFQLQFAIVASPWERTIPEPSTMALLATSLLLMGWVLRRKANCVSA